MKMNNSGKFFLRSGSSRKEARVDLRNLLRTEKYCNVRLNHRGSSILRFYKGKEKTTNHSRCWSLGEEKCCLGQ